MTQKDKVKELVGRGLHSYHTKALQQMDRIEKKNKEQNHKISILTNELDNDYLTKTEECSVVSLEHSKEGMVYIDELQGNTMVNYCTDGSKEMTLNGDIDLEGTFITTTEGVDNGLVDVMCEGNTLVNLKYGSYGNDCNISWANSNTIEYFNRQEYSKIHCKGEIVETANNLGISWIYHIMGQVKLHLLKPNTTYTIKLNNKYDCINSILIQKGNAVDSYVKSYQKIDKDTYLIITKDSFEELSTNGIILYGTLSKGYKGSVDYKIIGMFEGDWSNKELPNVFFEGMKSVGQDDTNDHKIEILSHNGNLYDYDIYTKPFGNYLSSHKIHSNGIKVKANNQDTRGCSFIRLYANEDLYISLDIVGSGSVTKKLADNTYIEIYIKSNEKVRFKLEKGREYKIELNAGGTYDAEVLYDNIIISKNNYIDFIPRIFNKKEILLNEPLRGINDTIKDRFVKIGGKCYVERNCGEVLLDESKVWNVPLSQILENTILGYTRIKDAKPNSIFAITDKFKQGKPDLWGTSDNEGIYLNHNSDLIVRVNISKVVNTTSEDFKNYILSLNAKVIYQLSTPIYEPLEINPELITYTDVTHISNSSIIPCNMKIQNSGYNAIIKPSTLYTVALDTNKSGTIGMNLGGVKGTTTNNVLTLTTPATLTDDNLRLYGKGIKGSKVRLLEGDKTNWIPSYFEGMKSSFEDKLQDDGTYKMEFLSNNKNLFDVNKYNTNDKWYNAGWGKHNVQFENGVFQFKMYNGWQNYYIDFPFNLNEQYTIKFKARFVSSTASSGQIKISKYFTTDRYDSSELTGSVAPNGDWVEYTKQFKPKYRQIGFNCFISPEGKEHEGYWYIKDIQISKNDSSFINHKSNKIQFSSIEPLRGVDNTKDRFIFKDNKLMIERNCGYRRLDGTENWTKFNTDTKTVTQFYTDNRKQKTGTMVGTCTTVPWIGGRNANQEKEGLAGSGGAGTYLWLDVFNHKLETLDSNGIKNWLRKNNIDVVFALSEPTYEEIPFELQKIILEGYENGTLFFDTNIPPTSTVTYAGETPIVKATKLNKTEVLNNTNDINDNIIPYLMDMDYRVVCLQLQTENINDGVSMARLFGGTYEMLQRDIQSKRYSIDEYRHRLDAYLSANKITNEEYEKLGDMLNE